MNETKTEGYKELEDYFNRVINQPTTIKGETEMSLFTQLKEKINSLLTKPTKFVDETNTVVIDPPEDTWSFSMFTGPWYNDDTGEDVTGKSTRITEETNGTWMEQLDKILDVMSEHYGYNIKEQVYYSVVLPFNIEGEAGYGRCLNDEVFQKLLLSYPEVYELPTPMGFLKEKQ